MNEENKRDVSARSQGRHRRRLLSVLAGVLTAGAVCQPTSASTLDDKIITQLLQDKTWHINWAACMGGFDGCRTFWNWKKDGSVCARAIGANRDDKCADDGKWRIENGNLCWNLTWFGGGEGYKSVCIEIEKSSTGLYETKRVGGIGIKFFEFSVVP